MTITEQAAQDAARFGTGAPVAKLDLTPGRWMVFSLPTDRRNGDVSKFESVVSTHATEVKATRQAVRKASVSRMHSLWNPKVLDYYVRQIAA